MDKKRKWEDISKIILSMPNEYTLSSLMARMATLGIKDTSVAEAKNVLNFYQDENIIECTGYVYSLKPYLK